MPPKQKISKDSILEEGFRLMKNNGLAAVNARALAKKLGCSTQPIFSSFASMEELHIALIKKASDLYNLYIQEGLNSVNIFKGMILFYISFAQDEPELFKTLFIQKIYGKNQPVIKSDVDYQKIISSIEAQTALPRNKCEKLYFETWIFAHGVAVMLAAKTVNFTEKQIDSIIEDAFQGLSKRFAGNSSS